MTGPQWIRPSVDEYERLQERLSVALKSLADAEDKNATLMRDLELACRDLAAVKLSRDAAEAKLDDAEKHADALEKGLSDLASISNYPMPRWCQALCEAHAARRAARDGQEGTR